MKKILLLLVVAFALCLCACDNGSNIGTHPPARPTTTTTKGNESTNSTQPTVPTQPTQPDPCADGHTFPQNVDACSFCGVNYFEATLKFSPVGGNYIVSGRGTCTRTEIVIPETVNGKPVTVVGEDCFKNQDDITRVVLPDSIVEIRNFAFRSCESLKYINLPEGLTKIGIGSFYGCKKLNDVEFPSTLLKIEDEAFRNCASLTKALLPSSITHLGSGVFAVCSGLTQVELPSNIKELPVGLFTKCTALEAIEIPETITKIGNNFASQCPVKTIVIGNQVESIGSQAFAKCTELETVTIGSNVRSIGEKAFTQCSKLTSIILPDTVTSIGEKCFMDCVSLTSVNIPASVQRIGMDAFTNCPQLEANVYNGMAYLGTNENPYRVLIDRVDKHTKDLIIHDATTIMLRETFEGEPFENLYIGKSLENVSTGFLKGLKRLVTISVHPEHTQYHASGNCLIETKTKTLIKGARNSVIPDDGSVMTIGNTAYAYMEGITMIVIPNAVNRIQANAFAFCADLEALVIGSGMRVIGHDVLIECEKFESVFYCGTAEQWQDISIEGEGSSGAGIGFGGNKELLEATLYVYAKEQPAGDGNYWHYVDGVPSPW